MATATVAEIDGRLVVSCSERRPPSRLLVIAEADDGAVADALFGREPMRGRLPVDIPGLYPRGHGLEVD